jgi:hypothetical protein
MQASKYDPSNLYKMEIFRGGSDTSLERRKFLFLHLQKMRHMEAQNQTIACEFILLGFAEKKSMRLSSFLCSSSCK